MTLAMDEFTYALEIDYGMGTSFAVPQAAGVADLAFSLGWNSGNLTELLPSMVRDFNVSCSACGSGFLSVLIQIYFVNNIFISKKKVWNGGVSYGNSSALIQGQLIYVTNGYSCPSKTLYNPLTVSSTTTSNPYNINCGQPNWLCRLSIAGTGPNIQIMTLICCDQSGYQNTYYEIDAPNQNSYGSIFTKSFTFTSPAKAMTFSYTYISITGFSSWGGGSAPSLSSDCGNQVATGVAGWINTYIDQALFTCEDLCLTCTSGFFCTANVKHTCNAGYYCPADSSAPSICAAGYYSNNGASACSPCGIGNMCPNTGMTVPLTCNAGYACMGTTVSTPTPCVPGYASPGGFCSPCIDGSTYSSTQAAASCTSCSLKCPGGARVATTCNTTADIVCTPCLPGTYNGVGLNMTCSNCGPGNMCPNMSMTSPVSCNAGYYCPGNNTSNSITCNAGKYSYSGSSVCSSCGPGTFSAAIGAVSSATCQLCGSGTYSTALMAVSSATCLSCGAGNYSTALGANACSSCGPGTYSASTGAVTSGTCLLCDAGKFSTVTAAVTSASCALCLNGKYSTALGAASCTQCNTIATCTSPTQKFFPCNATSDNACISCASIIKLPDNATFNSDSSCNWTCIPAYAYLSNDQKSCLPCKADYYNCPLGQYLTTCTPTSNSVCTPCTNKIANSDFIGNGLAIGINYCHYACSPGYYRPYSTLNCVECDKGTYKNSIGNNEACTPCSPNTYTPNTASTFCTPCPLCTDPGQYNSGCSVGSNGTCTACQ